jgi:transposase InsO family protein
VRRYRQADSLRGLEEISRRPHHSPGRTAAGVEARVLELRGETGWGSRKLKTLLAEEQIHLARSTIDQVLRRHGVLEPEQGAARPAHQRFERAEPNELAQMDFKGEYRLRDGRWCYPLSLIDDHSRFSLGLYALASQQGKEVQSKLIDCFQQYGLPSAMLIDHGTPWWSPTNGHGLTKLSVWLIRQDIRLHLTGIRHPQTQGKVERFHRTLGEAINHWGKPQTLAGFEELFARFRSLYNERRPHESLGMRPPASRYRPSKRCYRVAPPPWQYSGDVTVLRLNPAGCLRYRTKQHFVSEALASEWVACHYFGDKLLIQYRQMYVREIDLRTGNTRPLVAPVASRSESSFKAVEQLKDL